MYPSMLKERREKERAGSEEKGEEERTHRAEVSPQ